MDMSEYFLIEDAVRDRLARMPRLVTILYEASVLRARPRAIDGYIDYFGESLVGVKAEASQVPEIHRDRKEST